ncbi:MAG: hypothetical protein EAX96_06000 [Candidatus Lokiarchaeota archaeon]|nr:hypothetical protein [Candidatus Lokiarchaeota archaeon]
MYKKITRYLAIASLFLLFLLSVVPWQFSTAVKITGPQEIQLTNSITDTFDVGCVRTPWDQYDIFVDSENESSYRVVDYDLSINNFYNAPTNTDYPLDLEISNGLTPSDPSTNTKWVVKYNNSDKFGSADISIKKFEEALAVGEKKVINIDPSSNILDIYMVLSAHTAYYISFTFVGGGAINVMNFVAANTILDPLGDQITTANQFSIGISTSFEFATFVAGSSGTHLMSIDYSGLIAAPVSLEVELKAIPETVVTSGVTTSKGDDFWITQQELMSMPAFTFEAFSMQVSVGESFDCELAQAQAAILLGAPNFNMIIPYFPAPTVNGLYTIGAPGAAATTGIFSAIALTSGKVFFIVMDTLPIMHHVNMVKYPIVSQAVDTTVNHEIDAYGMKTVSFNIGTQSLIWINGTKHVPVSVAAMGGFMQLLSSGMLTAVGTGLTVNNGTAGLALGKYYVLEPGTFYILLTNTAGTDIAWMNLEIKSYNSHINSSHDLWEDSYNGTDWAGFQTATDYTTIDFIQDGREHGSTIAEVISFTISKMTYINARFNFTIDQNQVFNVSADSWRVRLQYLLIGPHGYYTTNFKTVVDADGQTWNFDNTSTPSELSMGTMRLILPGTYKFVILVDNIWNTTGVDTVYNKNITFNFRILDYSNHYAWIDYQMPTEEPEYHAYAYAAGFRSVKYLNFSDPQVKYNHTENYAYNNDSMNGDQFDNGILLHVTGATPYSWTQILIYLNGTNINSFTIIYPTGFFDKYFNSFQTTNFGLTGLTNFGQSNTGGGSTNDTYAREFGVFASEYYIFINPGNTPLIIGIEIREYDTPLLQQVNLLAPPTTQVDLTGVVVVVVVVVVIIAIAAAVAGVIIYRRRQL